MIINEALELLQRGESAVVLFTRGPHLTLKPDGLSLSGNWRINANRIPDKVIVYLRQSEFSAEADLYIGNYVDTVPSPEQGRRIVRFTHARSVGTTDRNWHQFADTGTGPVRYLTK